MPDLHPSVASLGFLLGEWTGEGVGVYPTITPFTYGETVNFTHAGKPFLAYAQRTWRTGDHPDAGSPLHSETGYLRLDGDRLELVIAQPTGIVEVDEGTITGTSLALRSVTVATTSTARPVVSVERHLTVDGGTLRYQLWMGAVGQRHQIHLEATLHR
ncbi:MAG: FABP family protein [Acidimicrobiia bacterium]|nr:FABP family protein [Acidimicrobiia bacterium]